jgi:hypothetical protein
MRRAAMVLVLGLTACGGKVVFVGDDDGNGGSSSSTPAQGGSSSSTPTTSGPGTSGGADPTGGAGPVISCQSFECAIGQVGCSCDGECSICQGDACSGGSAFVQCSFDAMGGLCQCFFADQFLGECFEENPDCALESGCCIQLVQDALD